MLCSGLGLEGLVGNLGRGPVGMTHGGGHLAVAASLEAKRERSQLVAQAMSLCGCRFGDERQTQTGIRRAAE